MMQNAQPNSAQKPRRVRSPEAEFLASLALAEKARYLGVKALGVVFTVALIVQAWMLAQVFAELVLAHSFSIGYLALGLMAMLIRGLSSFARDWLSTSASRNIRFTLRGQLLAKLTRLGPARLNIDEDAGLSTRVYEQVDALDDYYSRYLPQVFMVSLIPCAILLAVLPVSWVAFAIFMVTAPLVIVFMVFVGHKAAQANRKQFAVLSMLSNQFTDLNQGLAELKRIDGCAQAKQRLASTASAYQKTTMKVLGLAFLSTATLELFASLAIAMVALYLGLGLLEALPWQLGESPVSLAQAMFLLLLAPEFYLPLRQLGNDYHAKQKAEAAATDLLEISHYGEASSVKQAAPNTVISHPPAPAGQANNSLISFTDFTWQEAGRTRFAAVTASIQAGQRVWLSGQSGVGKSSLLTVLLGFDSAYSGQLLLAGEDFRQINRRQWRQRLAWLPQSPEWVNGSIRRNLLLGISTARPEDIRQALRASQCDEFINALPEGLDTRLNEMGGGLSGGQMQRLAIARALLSKADVWLLDEPCSGLDADTAKAVLSTLEQVSQGKTLLLISHDTHPIHWADRHWQLTAEGLYEEAQQAIA